MADVSSGQALYFKVAASQFGATVFDTNDLSTIRGSSTILIRSAPKLQKHLQKAFLDEIAIIYASSSEIVGAVRVAASERPKLKGSIAGYNPKAWQAKRYALVEDCENEEAARAAAEEFYEERWPAATKQPTRENVVKQVLDAWHASQSGGGLSVDEARRRLNREIDLCIRVHLGRFRHFIFSRAFCLASKSDTLSTVFARLDTGLGLYKFGHEAVIVPEAEKQPVAHRRAFCALTLGRLPAAGVEDGQGIASGTRWRRQICRKVRNSIYRERLAVSLQHSDDPGVVQELDLIRERLKSEAVEFTQSFADIVADPPSHLPTNLRGKLAVVKIDGNGFGAKRLRLASNPSRSQGTRDFQEFSQTLEARSGWLVARLLDWLLAQPQGWSSTRTGSLRFETLLWGGDELIFVMPAWLASGFIGTMQSAFQEYRVPTSGAGAGELARFATGVVIASAKAPIRELQDAAEQLVGNAKRADKNRNMVDIVALEGIDQAELNINRIRARMFEGSLDDTPGAMAIDGAQWDDMISLCHEVSRDLGQSQLHRLWHWMEAEKRYRASYAEEVLTEFRRRLVRFSDGDALCRKLLDDTPMIDGAPSFPWLTIYQLTALSEYFLAEPASDEVAKAKAA